VTAATTATVANLGANASVTLEGNLTANTGALDLSLAHDTTNDTVNLTLNADYTEDNNTTSTNHAVTATVDATGIENINLDSTGNPSQPFDDASGHKADTVTNTLALTDNDLAHLTVSGDQAVVFTAAATQTHLATVDASANTGGANIDASAITATTQALHLSGSATAANTILGGSGGDTITGGSAHDVITGGAGADTMTGGAGNDVFVYNTVTDSSLVHLDTINDFQANTYGQGANGAATSAGADATSTHLTGDLIDLSAIATTFADTTINTGVVSNASDAQTFLQNMAADASYATTIGAALDSSSGNLYLDANHDGTVDSVIHLAGVHTLDDAAFVLA
jgi:S-layer protein